MKEKILTSLKARRDYFRQLGLEDMARGIDSAIEIVELTHEDPPAPGRYLPNRHPGRNRNN